MGEYQYEQELVRRYQTEVLGEAYFNQLMSYFDEPDERYKCAVMLQLETETKARVRSLMMNLGMDVAESEESRRTGISMAEEMRGKNWPDAMSAFRDLALTLLEEEKEIAANAPPEHRSYAQSMIAHGQCFFDFTELELSGRSEVSLGPIVELLQHKVPLVSSVLPGVSIVERVPASCSRAWRSNGRPLLRSIVGSSSEVAFCHS